MPLLSRTTFGGLGLGLSLLLGSGCFEDPPPATSGGTEASDDSGETGADETSTTPDPTVNPTAGGCAGCLDMAGGCLAGNLDQACGALAAACVACDDGSFCNDGTCERLPACNESNCEGCCDGDDCLVGTEAGACGESGQQCGVCTGDSTCRGGSCELPCSATCDGCCDTSGTCIPLDTTAEAACGAQGEACTQCEEGFACADGMCISSECQATCEGCCVGDECLTGDLGDACGVSGAACLACPSGTVCEDTCVADPDTIWQVIVHSATTATTAPDGSSWDLSGGLPDPFVEITFLDLVETSSVIEGTTTPVWEEQIFDGLTTDQLLVEPGVYEIWDHDLTSLNDSMGQCVFLLSEDQFGVPLVAECTDDNDEPIWSLQLSIVAAE